MGFSLNATMLFGKIKMLHKIKGYKNIFYILASVLILTQNIFSQNIDAVNYPKADIHLGISLLKGSYIGTIYQVSNDFSFEASYGWNLGLFLLQPGEDKNIISVGINYHFHYFILNLTYAHFEKRHSYFSHIGSINIELFSVDNKGFHLIGGVGGFYELGKYFSDKPKEGGVNFNLALGFTFL
jgi:hypothetical protein